MRKYIYKPDLHPLLSETSQTYLVMIILFANMLVIGFEDDSTRELIVNLEYEADNYEV